MTDTTTAEPEGPTFTPQPRPEGRDQGLARLREPFPPHQVNLLPKQQKRDDQDKGKCDPSTGRKYSADGRYCGGWHARSVHLDYVGHAALTDRLLDADPEWTWEPVAFTPEGLPALDREGGLWIRLTVQGVTRLGYGDAQGKKGPNAVKEAIGDGLRNAAMRFGAALDLWHKGDLHDAAEEQGKVDAPGQQSSQSAPPAERPNQERRVQRPAVDGEGDEWVARGLGVETADQVMEVFQAAKRAGALGASATVNGRTMTVRDYLRERGAGLRKHEEAARARRDGAAGSPAAPAAPTAGEQPLRPDVLDPQEDPAPWDLAQGEEPF